MKKLLTSLIISSIFISNSFAADKNFVVNPNTMRGQLFSKNMSLLQALNNVQNSKLNVSMARAKLLPTLNLGVLLPALGNPTFLLSSVTFLFPFLVPSNWAVLKQQKDLFESDKASYKALQLNILSNALSLYYIYMNDQKVKNVYADQSDLLTRLYTILKKQSDVLGNVTSEDLNMSQAQMEEAKIRVSKLTELLVEEKAGLRSLLGLPLGTEVIVEDADLLPSEYEGKSVGEIADHSMDVAPEFAQMAFLVKASEAGKFAKMFGFMSNASLSGTATNGNSPFDNLKAGGAFSFGADNLVNIKIANNNLASILLRADQLKLENEKSAEIVVGKMTEVKEQQVLSALALSSHVKVFEGQRRQFNLGLISLQALLQTESQLTDSKISNLKIDMDLKMQRLTLQRLVIDGDFSKVKGCTATIQPENKSIFHRKDKEQSLDQLCQAE